MTSPILPSVGSLHVVKRSGHLEPMRFDKISDRIIELSSGLNVDPSLVTMLSIKSIISGMRTSEIDNLVAETCYCLATYNPDYDTLASKILVSNLHKSTSGSYSTTLDLLMYNKDIRGETNQLINSEMYTFAKKHISKLESALDYSLDYTYSYFSLKTLEKSYLLKDSSSNRIIERPQHCLLRVSLGIHYPRQIEYDNNNHHSRSDNDPTKQLELNNKLEQDALDRTLETYYGLSHKYFTQASPTLFNAGTTHPQLASCFLLNVDDDLDHIYKTLHRIAKISKFSGGTSLNISNIRASNSLIRSTNGKSTGILPMLQVFNKSVKYVNQGGKRNGSLACYIELWHADIFDFIDLRLNDGAPDEIRCKDLFLALWVNDLFMKRLLEKGVWSLFCPDTVKGLTTSYGEEFEKIYLKAEAEKKYVRQIPAEELWLKILNSQQLTGQPYMLWKDNVNKKSNHKNIGTICCSNLCVSPDTMILTSYGWDMIKNLADKKINIWNGKEWSETIVKHTGTNQKLLRVHFDNGEYVDCTEYHKFPITKGSKCNRKGEWKYDFVEAKKLIKGQRMLKYDLPIIEGDINNNLKYPYTEGFFSGDGTYDIVKNKKIPKIYLYNEKKNLLNDMERRMDRAITESDDRIMIYIPEDISEKYTVPLNAEINNKLRWLEGFCDADGCLCNNDGTISIQITNTNLEFLRRIRLLLQTLGSDCKISILQLEGKRLLPDHKDGLKYYDCKTVYRACISTFYIEKLIALEFAPKRLKLNNFIKGNRNASRFTRIKNVEQLENLSDTFCFTEPKRSMGMFNGMLLGNCAEIVEYTDGDNIAVCTLGSMSLPAFFTPSGEYDYKELGRWTEVMTVNLNRILDYGYFPIPEATKTNSAQRAIGIGVQGLQEVLFKLRLSWGDQQTTYVNRMIFETLYYYACKKSAELASIEGKSYKFFEGSPVSQGILQYDMWNSQPISNYDWTGLKEACKRGIRNSLLIALMPTAATAQILSNTESFECQTSNIYYRKVLAGEFPVVNKFLMKDLKERNLLTNKLIDKIILQNGSVQNIDEIPKDLQDLYRTVWEYKQKVFVDLSIDRAPFIDQTQSLNIFLQHPTIKELSSLHKYTWEKGLKTGSYYIRSQPARDAQKISISVDDGKKNNQSSSHITAYNTSHSVSSIIEKKPDKKVICTDEVCTVCSS